ncbi:hypothetical protein [Yoonia sp.]|uniref:DUF7742 family protein n=1 Tax=Yoonia sp. TaxID=2212373 RepID=UPI0019D83FA9|nr:hypothetical protein [Yoonia sp.]MBE0414643.1 hypothetical protein [Yoonia sp.]
MRAVQLADIECAMRHLLQVPPAQRRAAMADLLARADSADRYRKRLRRRHPDFGDGTLMAAAMGQGVAPRPAACDAQVLACLDIVITVLRARKAR